MSAMPYYYSEEEYQNQSPSEPVHRYHEGTARYPTDNRSHFAPVHPDQLQSPTMSVYSHYNGSRPTTRSPSSGYPSSEPQYAVSSSAATQSYQIEGPTPDASSVDSLPAWGAPEWSEPSHRHQHHQYDGLPTGYYMAPQPYYSTSFAHLPAPLSPNYRENISPQAPSVLAMTPYTAEVHVRPPNLRTYSAISTTSGPDGYYSSDQDARANQDDEAVKPFILKLYHMLASPEEYSDVISWDPLGTSFVVSHTERFAKDVLPALFGHGNIASFTRQLNVYSFVRLTTSELRSMLGQQETSELSGWRHTLLRRGDEASLGKLKPRPSKARQAKKAERAVKAAAEEEEYQSSWQSFGGEGGLGPAKSATAVTSHHQNQQVAHPYSRPPV